MAPITRTPKVVILGQSAVAVPHTGDTTETTLATITIPAGAMGASGRIEIDSLWSTTNNANTKTVWVKFGGTAINNVAVTTSASLRLLSAIANRTAGTQVTTPISLQTGTSGTAVTTASIDTTAAVDVTLTGKCANAADTVTLEAYCVKLIRP